MCPVSSSLSSLVLYIALARPGHTRSTYIVISSACIMQASPHLRNGGTTSATTLHKHPHTCIRFEHEVSHSLSTHRAQTHSHKRIAVHVSVLAGLPDVCQHTFPVQSFGLCTNVLRHPHTHTSSSPAAAAAASCPSDCNHKQCIYFATAPTQPTHKHTLRKCSPTTEHLTSNFEITRRLRCRKR